MNYHSDAYIMERVREHYNEALEYFPENRIVACILQGSQNYGLDYEGSDIDTKLIVVPTFEDIARAREPVSTTHVRANDEHIDFKDVRRYIQTFRKQNLNFLEILFSKYSIVNKLYANEFQKLLDNRENICRYNEIQAIKSMRGIAHEKVNALEHRCPARMAYVEQYGYDPKQLSHLFRVEEYLRRYIAGEPYADCLISKQADFLIRVKTGEEFGNDIEAVRRLAKQSLFNIDTMCDDYLNSREFTVDKDVDELLNDVQVAIMKIALLEDLKTI